MTTNELDIILDARKWLEETYGRGYSTSDLDMIEAYVAGYKNCLIFFKQEIEKRLQLGQF